MNEHNARRIADAVTEAFRVLHPSTKVAPGIKPHNASGVVYLLLAENVEDCVCALLIFINREPVLGQALTTILKGIPHWSEIECEAIIQGFKNTVIGPPLITTALELRSRCLTFTHEVDAIAQDPEKQAHYQSVLS